MVAGPKNSGVNVYLQDRQTGAVELVSVGIGTPVVGTSVGPAMTPSGRYVAFESNATNLVAGDTQNDDDIFVRDRALGVTVCASVDASGAHVIGDCDNAAIAADGSAVVFESTATTFVAGDTNNVGDVFVRDLVLGTTLRISVDSLEVQGNAAASITRHAISGDGQRIVFWSAASNLVAGDTNATNDVFLRDRAAGTTVRLSVDSVGAQGDGSSFHGSISEDGNFALFTSAATNLVPGDTNGFNDVFGVDVAASTIERVSVGSFGVQSNGSSNDAAPSLDGRFVAFLSGASNLGPGAPTGGAFLHDRLLATTVRVSVGPTGQSANASCDQPAISQDGATFAFTSLASNLVAGDATAAIDDVFVGDSDVAAPVVTYCTAKQNSAGCAPRITSSGSPRVGGYDNFFVIGANLLTNKPGLFFFGFNPAAIPFGGGLLCVQPPLVRSPVLATIQHPPIVACSGFYTFHFDQAYAAQQGLRAGDTVRGQFWSRDPAFAPPENVGLTDGLAFTLVP